MLTPGPFSIALPGPANSIRFQGLFFTNRWKSCRPRNDLPNDHAVSLQNVGYWQTPVRPAFHNIRSAKQFLFGAAKPTGEAEEWLC